MVRLTRLTEESGAVAILVAALATVLFGLAAIVVDLGYARTIQSQAQSSVDAASLAGAGTLSTDSNPPLPFLPAIDAIKTSAQSNFGTAAGEWNACTATKPGATWVQGGSGTDCILFNRAFKPTKLQVVLPSRHVDSFFGGLFGYGGMDVSAQAQATIREEDLPGCALCVQGLLDTRGAVRVDSGGLGGSSSAGSGRVRTGGSITVQSPGGITFAATPTPASGAQYSPSPRIRPVSDPFAGSPMPTGNPDSPLPVFPIAAPTGTVTCGPGGVLTEGTYRNINVTASSAINPCRATGVIVVTGLLQVRSAGYLTATSSAIQLSCGTRTAPTKCASVRAGGRLVVNLGGQIAMSGTAPTGFSIVADPNNNSRMMVNGALSVDQAIYGRLTRVGVGAATSLSGSGPISVGRLDVAAGGSVNVSAAGGTPLAGPPDVGLFQ